MAIRFFSCASCRLAYRPICFAAHAMPASGYQEISWRHHVRMISVVLVCLVVGISDGDSMTVRCAAAEPQRQVRIHAIDAPERHQSFSEAARNSLSALCLDSRARILPVDTDDYARTVAQVECRGEDAASHQVGAGLAWVYARYARMRPDLPALQARARAERRGLWSDAHPVAPWLWRHR